MSVSFQPANFLGVGSLEQLNVNGNRLREIFYPDPSSKSDIALTMDEGERLLVPFSTLRCLLLGACVFYSVAPIIITAIYVFA